MKLEDFKKEELIYALNACQPLFDPLAVLKEQRFKSCAEELEKISKYRKYVLADMQMALNDKDNERFWKLNSELAVTDEEYIRIEMERNKYI